MRGQTGISICPFPSLWLLVNLCLSPESLDDISDVICIQVAKGIVGRNTEACTNQEKRRYKKIINIKKSTNKSLPMPSLFHVLNKGKKIFFAYEGA